MDAPPCPLNEGDFVERIYTLHKSSTVILWITTNKQEEEKFMSDMKSNGEHIEYYSNGKIRLKTIYRFGTKNGLTYEYNPNGTLRSKAFYKLGQKAGEYLEYNYWGGLRLRANYRRWRLNEELLCLALSQVEWVTKKSSFSLYETLFILSVPEERYLCRM